MAQATAPPTKPGANAPPASEIVPAPGAPAAPARPETDIGKFPALPGIGIDLMTLGRTLVQSGYFTDLRQISQAIVKVLAGQELGIGPIRAMTDIHVVHVKEEDGGGRSQVALGATLMASLIQRSGRFDYAVLELTDDACEIEFHEFRTGSDGARIRVALGRSRFTTEDAKKAKLAGKANWQHYPRNMNFSRAMSNGAKWYCSSVFGGAVYTPEEIRDIAPEAEAPEPVSAPTAPTAAEPPVAQEDRPPAAPESPDAGPTEGKAGPAGGAPPGAAAGPSMGIPVAPPGEDAATARARELTWQRMLRAMASCGMTEQEMRGLAKTFYRADPDTMPVDQLALLAGRIEDMVGRAMGAIHPGDAAKAAAERRAGA